MSGQKKVSPLLDQTAETGRFRYADLAAVAVAALIFGYLFYTAATGMGSIDESFYYTIVQRQLAGDRLLIDEWHVSQLSSVLQIFPYWLYTTLAGSAEGVILYLRYVYLTVDLILYWFIYVRLRRYGVWAVLSAALFCTCIPSSICTLNYYTMALHGLTVTVLLIGFGKEKKSVPILLLTGIVIACTVLSEPFIAVLYFIWCVLVLCRKLLVKKEKPFLEGYAFALDGRLWFISTVGIGLTVAVFFTYLLTRSPLGGIVKTVPELFTDHEYAFGGEGGSSLIEPGKLIDAIRFYGWLPPIVGFLIPLAAAVLRRKHLFGRFRRPLFYAACLCSVCSYVYAAVLLLTKEYLIGSHLIATLIIFYFYFQGFPVLFFGLDCYALCEKKDRRVFLFWLVGFAASVMVDLSSELVLGVCAAVTFPAMVVSLRDLVLELRNETKTQEAETVRGGHASAPKEKHSGRVPAAAAALCLAVLFCWEGFNVYARGFYGVVERITNVTEDRAVTATVSAGPLKGVRTTARISGIYDDILSDLDEIKACTKGPVYVMQRLSYCYLYLEMPVGTYSTWYVEEDSEVRQTRYWELHPENRPTYIYIPFYDAYYYQSFRENPVKADWGSKKLAFLRTLCECESTEGNAGYIVRVERWLT